MISRHRRLGVRGLCHPWLPLVLALLAVALTLPSLSVGWELDDLFHRAVLLGRTDLSPWSMFSPLRGDPVWLRSYVDSGAGPWWTPEDFRLASRWLAQT